MIIVKPFPVPSSLFMMQTGIVWGIMEVIVGIMPLCQGIPLPSTGQFLIRL
jgi:hypothetical protein